jgi:hypothetical protein
MDSFDVMLKRAATEFKEMEARREREFKRHDLVDGKKTSKAGAPVRSQSAHNKRRRQIYLRRKNDTKKKTLIDNPSRAKKGCVAATVDQDRVESTCTKKDCAKTLIDNPSRAKTGYVAATVDSKKKTLIDNPPRAKTGYVAVTVDSTSTTKGGAPVRSTSPANVKRRQRYKLRKNVTTAKTLIDNPSPTKKRFVAQTIATAMKTKCGRRSLGGLQQLLRNASVDNMQKKDSTMTKALKSVIAKFPEGSQGRKIVVGAANTAVDQHERHVLRETIGVTPRYARKAAVAVTTNPNSTISTHSGHINKTWTSITPTEGADIVSFFYSEASAKSGQKSRLWGETLYTEQFLWRLYVKYRAECFGHYLNEALSNAEYATEIPDKVSVHQANCWHALWKSQQPGFDLLTELSDRLQVRKKKIYIKKRQKKKISSINQTKSVCVKKKKKKKGRSPSSASSGRVWRSVRAQHVGATE